MAFSPQSFLCQIDSLGARYFWYTWMLGPGTWWGGSGREYRDDSLDRVEGVLRFEMG